MTIISQEIWQNEIFSYLTLPEINKLGRVSKQYLEISKTVIGKILLNQENTDQQDMLSSKELSKLITQYGKELKSLNFEHRFIFDNEAFSSIGKALPIEILNLGVDIDYSKLSFSDYKSLKKIVAKNSIFVSQSRFKGLKNLETIRTSTQELRFEEGKEKLESSLLIELSPKDLRENFSETNSKISKGGSCILSCSKIYEPGENPSGLLTNLIKLIENNSLVESIDFNSLVSMCVQNKEVESVYQAFENSSHVTEVSVELYKIDFINFKKIFSKKFFENVTALRLKSRYGYRTLNGFCALLAECFPKLEKLDLGALGLDGGDEILKDLQNNIKYLEKLRMFSCSSTITGATSIKERPFTDQQIKALAKERPWLHFDMRLYNEYHDEDCKFLKLQGNYAEIKNAKEIFFVKEGRKTNRFF